MERIFRKLAILTILSLIVSALLIMPASASSKCKLVKEHKYKVSYYKNGKWTSKGIKYYLAKYKYDKHNNWCATTQKYCKSKNNKIIKTGTTRRKLTYKKGKLSKCSDSYEDGYFITEFRKGIPVRYKYGDTDGTGFGEYGYKARYVETDKDTYLSYDDDVPYTRTISYDIQTKNGYPVLITHEDWSEKIVVEFYTKGSKKGLVKKAIWIEYGCDGDDRIESRHSKFRYSYKMKGGLVKSYTVKALQTEFDGTINRYIQKGTFTYTKKKADAKRYRSMINDIVGECQCDGANTYIRTYW